MGEIAGELVDFVFADGNVAPVVLPGVVENIDGDADVASEVLALHFADGDVTESEDAFAGFERSFAEVADGVAPGDKVFDWGEAGGVEVVVVVGPPVRHADHGWGVESVNQGAGFLVDGERDGAAHPFDVAGAQPVFGGADECLRDLRVVDALEESKEAGALVVVGVVFGVDLRGDASDGFSVALGKEELRFAVTQERGCGRGSVGPFGRGGAPGSRPGHPGRRAT